VEPGGSGRGCLKVRRENGCASQCAAPEAPLGAIGEVKGVKRLGAQAEGGAHCVAPMADDGSVRRSREEGWRA
jgi:hypothetical protein